MFESVLGARKHFAPSSLAVSFIAFIALAMKSPNESSRQAHVFVCSVGGWFPTCCSSEPLACEAMTAGPGPEQDSQGRCPKVFDRLLWSTCRPKQVCRFWSSRMPSTTPKGKAAGLAAPFVSFLASFILPVTECFPCP